MRNVVSGTAIALVAVGSMVAAQGPDAAKVLADARLAMGGDKLAAVKTLSATGRTVRSLPNGNTMETEFEFAIDLPDKYLMRTVMMAMGNMSIYRNTGFNGGQVIEEIDRPPNLAAGAVMHIRVAGPGGTTDIENMTPEQKAEFNRTRLLSNRKEFARLALGIFAAAPVAFPLELTYAGQAEAGDGKADAIDVKGEGDFAARLFMDATTHLPLMLSWQDKEPLVIQNIRQGGPAGPGALPPPPPPPGGGDVNRVFIGGGVAAGAGMGNMSKEERAKFEADLEARRKDAEAKRRIVEFRIFYADYQAVDGVQLPHRIQRSIDGKPTEEMIFETFKVNAKIDPRKFQPSK